MRPVKTAAALALASIADAIGIEENVNISICMEVDIIINVLHSNQEGRDYCSSITTAPAVTVTEPVTFIEATTITGVITTTVTPTVTATSTVAETTTVCDASPQKRNVAHLPPAPLPDCLKPYPPPSISPACGCAGYLATPTPTVTVTSTVSVTPTSLVTAVVTETAEPVSTTETVTSTSTFHSCPAPTACGNQGLQWIYLDNTSGDNNDNTYSAFVPDDYKGKTPIGMGVTNSIGGINVPGGQNLPIYGSNQTFRTDFFILTHEGYIYAQQSGTYTFKIDGVDDALYIWVGDSAFSGWSQSNTNSMTAFNGGPGTGTFTVDFSEGNYYPVQIMFAQAQGVAVFEISVVAPDGTVFLGANTLESPYLVQFSCDGTTAPPFPDWTAEQ